MTASYDLAWNAGKTRLTFALHGTWDAATMARWNADYRAAVAQATGQGWTVLGDMTDHPLQADAIQKGHEALMAYSIQHGMSKAALVVPKAVASMQLKRLAGQAQASQAISFVTSVAEGERALGTP